MPLKFDALKHPRDKRGRFTKSRTVLASAKDKKAVKEIAAGFKPDKTGDGKSYAAKIADPGQQKTASDFALDAKAVNEDLRAGHADAPGVKPMDDAMRPLPDDLVLHRSVPATAFGGIDPQSLAGMKVRDAGFSPTQIDAPQPSDGSVHLFIAAPKGSRAVVNAETGEVYLDRDSEMVVSRVEKNPAGGHDMYMTVLPKTGSKDSSSKAPAADDSGKADIGKAAVADTGKKADAPAGQDAKPSKPEPKTTQTPTTQADKPAGGDELRASLMKQTVADLQGQLRERGLKPGKKRKSELVDALVADETGGSHDSGPAGKPEKAAADYPDRLAAAATGGDALLAAPLSLVREDTHERPGNRSSRGGLTVDERAALYEYQAAAYIPINGRLRDLADGEQPESRPQTIEQIRHLDAAMQRSALSQDVVVYRGITQGRAVFGDRIDGDLTDMQWQEAAFVSTSAEAKVVEPFAGIRGEPVRMRILAPAGAHALQVSPAVDKAGYDDEAELLLDRNTRMRVAADHGVVDEIRHIDVEVML